MATTVPRANAGSAAEREKIRRVVAARGLVGAANDTKWGELLDAMRSREGWRPSYRFRCVDGMPSGWDVEWSHHVPLPMISVEWLDLGLVQEVSRGRLAAPERIDHRSWILPLLAGIGLDHEVVGEVARIFGYHPRNREGLDEEVGG